MNVLTQRQREIVELLVLNGWSNKHLARHLGVAEGTIKVHLHEVYERLGVTTRLGLMRRVFEERYADQSS